MALCNSKHILFPQAVTTEIICLLYFNPAKQPLYW